MSVQFDVTILGSGAALPTSQRNPSAQYVCCNDRHFLIDCGEGTQSQLRKYGIKFQKISHIFISHLHGDHFFGLVGLLSSMHLLGREKELIIYGPAELEQLIRPQLEIGGARLAFQLRFVIVTQTPGLIFEDNKLEVRSFPLRHRVPTNGFCIIEKPKERSLDGDRFKADGLSLTIIPALRRGEDITLPDGNLIIADDYTFPPKPSRSYAYCSDTAYDEGIVVHINGVDLLYHEATFAEAMSTRAKETFHSTALQAARIAKLANAKQLVLGHLSARYESGEQHLTEAKIVFDDVLVAEDGLVIRL